MSEDRRRVRHRFHAAPTAFQDGQLHFTTEQTHQIRHVLRLGIGERVRVFDGVRLVDRIVRLDRLEGDALIGIAEEERPQSPEPPRAVSVGLALLQRDHFERALAPLVEVGVASVRPVLTARGLVREPPSAVQTTRWSRLLQEAAEQCGRGRVPELLPALSFNTALEAAVAAGPVIVAYERAAEPTVAQAVRALPPGPGLTLFIGPEGGFADEEVTRARAAGACLATLGPRVLRVATAAVVGAALAVATLEEPPLG